MLRKLVRAVFTIVGAVLGYGAFLLVKFLARFFGHDDWVNFTNMQEFYISVSFALIFGLIFFQLTPTIKKQGNKMADNIESDLKKVSTNDIVMGTAGLIAGLIIAFLISQIYAGIKIPYLSVILNIITYILLGYLGITIATKKVRISKRSGLLREGFLQWEAETANRKWMQRLRYLTPVLSLTVVFPIS